MKLMPQKNFRCKKCIMDSSIKGILFDSEGVCNFCHLHFLLAQQFPIVKDPNYIPHKIIEKIKQRGIGKKYDCITGISGGCDSTYTLYLLKKWKLRVLAIHFNDGWGNPEAGKNITNAVNALGVDFNVISSDWRESKDIKVACLKASVPELDLGTDLGIAAALYGAAVKYDIKTIVIGNSFRTEGIMPLEWNFMDGTYLSDIQKKFGSRPLRLWKADDPGFNLTSKHIVYYIFLKGIKTIPILSYVPYNKKEVAEMLSKEVKWQDPGGRYFDDLYQGFMSMVLRTKFNIDFRIPSLAALVRENHISYEEALSQISSKPSNETERIIELAIQRLGVTKEEVMQWLKEKPKSFRDYKTIYPLFKLLRFPVWLFSELSFLPKTAYYKYYKCG